MNFENIITRYPDNIRCLDNIAKKENMENGLSDYWNAKYITLFSKQNIFVNQINYTDLRPVNILNNRYWYKDRKYSFIVVDKLDEAKIRTIYGNPLQIIDCGWNIFIYSFFEIPQKD